MRQISLSPGIELTALALVPKEENLMRQVCVVLAMLGPIACGSEYTPRGTGETSAIHTGGADAATALGGNTAEGGSASSSAAPIQGGAATSVTSGVAGSGVATGGMATGGMATGGVAGAPSVAGSTGVVLADCSLSLPAPSTTGVAKPSGAPGNLRVLNWAGFKGAISFTLDDNNQTVISRYSQLNALGVPFTFFLWTGNNGATNPIWDKAVKDGHELGNHSKYHTQLAADSEIDAATEFIQTNFGVRPWTLAAPYGDTSYAVAAKGKFIANRGIAPGVVTPNDSSNPLNLPAIIPDEGALASQINELIDAARLAGGWQILVVHGFIPDSSAYHPLQFTEFTTSVNHAKSLGDMWLDTMVDVASYWVGQKLVSSTQATSTGTDLTYSWTLPTPYPPGKCLRVVVDGGTLKQGGQVLEWNGHGYYEISLDVGSVTISP